MAPLEFLIKVIADTKGATDTTEALRKVQEAAVSVEKEQATATRDTGRAMQEAATGANEANTRLRRFGQAGRESTGIMKDLERASLGGKDALFGLAGAVRGIVQVVTTGLGPAGIFAAAVGVVGGLALAFKDKLFPATNDATEALGKTASQAKTTAEAIEIGTEAAERYNRIKLDAAEAEFQKLDEKISANVEHLESALELQQQLLSAQTSRQIAEIKARPDLSASDKQSQISELELNFQQAQARTPVERAKIRADAEQERLEGRAGALQDLISDRDRLIDQWRQTTRDLADAPKAIRELNQRRAIIGERLFGQTGESPTREEQQRLIEEQSVIYERLEAIQKFRDVGGEGEKTELAKKARGAQDAVLAAEEELRKQTAALAAAREKQARLAQQVGESGTRDPQTILGNQRLQFEVSQAAAARDAQAAAEESRVRLTNQEAAQRARESAERALKNPRLTEEKRERAEAIATAAGTAEKSGTTSDLIKLREELNFSGRQSPQLRKIIADVNAAGSASQEFDKRQAAQKKERELQNAFLKDDPIKRVDAQVDAQRTPLAEPIIDGQKIGEDIGTAAADAINAKLADIPGRASGGPVRKGQAYIVGEKKPEVFVPDQDGTIQPDAASPGQAQQPAQAQQPGQAVQPGQAQQPAQAEQPGQARQPGQAKQPDQAQAPNTFAPSNSNPIDEPDGVINSNAEAIQRTEEKSAAFRADPANAPKRARPPTPPNPAGSGLSNKEWKEAFQGLAASMPRSASASEIGASVAAALSSSISQSDRRTAAALEKVEAIAAKQSRQLEELIRAQRRRSVA